MIKFRQKEYVLPAALLTVGKGTLSALNVAGNAAAVGGIIQGSQQMKQAEQQAEEQAAQNRKITKALNNIAENAKNNPQAAQQAADVMGQKQFARINLGGIKKTFETIKNSKTGKNAIGFAKDIGGYIKSNRDELLGGTMAGGALAASSYITDRAIQHDMKKNGIPLQKNYANVSGSILSGLKKAGRATLDAAKNRKGTIATMAVLGSAPTALGYMAEKQQLKDQIESTSPIQKTYTIKLKSIGNMFGKAGKWIKGKAIKAKTKWENSPLRNTPGQTILGTISNLSGGGGRKGVEDFANTMINSKSGSEWSKTVGGLAKKYPKTALATSIPIGVGTMAVTWDAGEKLVRKTAKAADDNAYAYQESKEQQIPQQ